MKSLARHKIMFKILQFNLLYCWKCKSVYFQAGLHTFESESLENYKTPLLTMKTFLSKLRDKYNFHWKLKSGQWINDRFANIVVDWVGPKQR